jgi:hypothetical protein
MLQSGRAHRGAAASSLVHPLPVTRVSSFGRRAQSLCRSSRSEPSQALYATASTTARAKVLQLLGEGLDMYTGSAAFAPLVEQLIAENPTQQPGNVSVALGQGTWQVRAPAPAQWLTKLLQALQRRDCSAPAGLLRASYCPHVQRASYPLLAHPVPPARQRAHLECALLAPAAWRRLAERWRWGALAGRKVSSNAHDNSPHAGERVRLATPAHSGYARLGPSARPSRRATLRLPLVLSTVQAA